MFKSLSLIGLLGFFAAPAHSQANLLNTQGNPQDTLGETHDSTKIKMPSAKRQAYLGVYAGISFFDFSAKTYFVNNLDSLRRANHWKSSQDFESVHLAFPIGFLAGIPIHNDLDIIVGSKSFWYQQNALSQDSTHSSYEESYAVQAHSGGVGIKYYIPSSVFSVNKQIGLFISVLPYWNLGFSEIYSTSGKLPATLSFAPIGYDIQLGFQHDASKSLIWQGALTFSQAKWQSDKAWIAIIPTNNIAGKASWELSGLEFQFRLLWTPSVKPLKPNVTTPPVINSLPNPIPPPITKL